MTTPDDRNPCAHLCCEHKEELIRDLVDIVRHLIPRAQDWNTVVVSRKAKELGYD